VANNFGWSSPPSGASAEYGRLVTHRFATLADYQNASGQDRHSVTVGLDAFRHVGATDQADPARLYQPEDYDFTLLPGSAAIDSGIELPTVNDGFTGRAPDLGALEAGRPAPHYGPRQWPAGSGSSDARSFTGPPR
jgi:hypothetical protein